MQSYVVFLTHQLDADLNVSFVQAQTRVCSRSTVPDLSSYENEGPALVLGHCDDLADARKVVENLNDHPEVWMKILACDDLTPSQKCNDEQGQAIIDEARQYV